MEAIVLSVDGNKVALAINDKVYLVRTTARKASYCASRLHRRVSVSVHKVLNRIRRITILYER